MYAIIKSGGKQYKVEPGTVVKVEKLDAEVGAEVSFEVLMTSDGKTVQVGDPLVADVAVKGKVLAQDKAKKVIVFKYKAKKDYRKKQGHRQPYTKVEIIQVGSEIAEKKAKPATAKKADAATAEKKPAAKATTAEKKPVAKKAAAKPAEKKPAAKTTEKKAATKETAAKKTATAEKKPAAKKETKTADTKAE